MKYDNRLIYLISRYAPAIRTSFPFHIGGQIPAKKLKNAMEYIAPNVDRSNIIGFYDTTVTGSGKSGYVFTKTNVCYKDTLSKPQKLWYDEIESVKLFKTYKKKPCDQEICFYLYDGSVVSWSSSLLNKPPLLSFFNEVLKIINEPIVSCNQEINYKEKGTAGIKAGGTFAGNYKTVNKLYDEERFNARQGHGFAAERANNLYDKLTGHDAKILGDDNALNGADRIVDGVHIQSKYCATGSRCINECFENGGKGVFRYMQDGKPMQIEVPSDKYDAALKAMEDKIRNGQVEGVSDPSEAKNIVRKGHFTYEQAKNIAKAGTVESLVYDAVNGVIIASSAFGVTATITFAVSVWNGEDFGSALKIATYSGLKVGGVAFATSILASQLSKAGLNSALVSSSEKIVSLLGPKVSSYLANAFRHGKNIYGAAAMKSAAKLLRGNIITAGVTVVVMSSFDVANIFRRRISGKQLFKNFTNTLATVGGGTGGGIAGATIGTAILPGVGTVVGGVIGSLSGGAITGKVNNKLVGHFIEDDAKAMVRIIEGVFSEMVSEYILNKKETEKSADKLSQVLDGKCLKNMYASDDRNFFAREILTPIFEEQLYKRPEIQLPTEEQMVSELRNVLEECLEDIVDDGMKD